ncbi:SDR family NAD(P)-dependent oxidoreductase [Mesorhizobium sp.]|uniref:SDR family NAD(P)-dependent oxidoreductase n=1 Tax=Mesorhizobium sp. TaxID=1871066 RepID=UPI000FE7A3CE|nr:SDR family NAD(P)-dependent oxidoreductase [Mesorhizobium sp.]RWP09991.1 MAG: SDR family oxidoreductase [Mesorhizobium sp.]TIU41324.1 MAG: SDR family oxidoreductase [Mesorhizobium sp.]
MSKDRRVAVVTGGASGIGFGIAQAMQQAGYAAVLIGRDEDRLRKAAKRLGPHASWRRADVGKRHEIQAALAPLDRVDVLVNAAGFTRSISLSTPIGDAEADWDALIEANLKGSFLMTHAMAPLLASPGGRVINIGSIGAQTGGSRPGSLAYAAAKSGLHGLTYALARELAPRAITANVIAPGFIADTGFTGAWPQDRVAAIVAETPMARPGTPADIAGAVLWLASDAGSFVTGAVIPVNGGWRIG